jgi:hypothetical protein
MINVDVPFSKNSKMWSDENIAKLNVQKRAMILEEFKLGIWTKEEYLEQIAELDSGLAAPARKQQKVRAYSPDWNEDDFYASS